MPRCYLLAVAKSSALDESTNSWSLFNLVEEVQIGGLTEEQVAEGRPVLPFEVHVQWEFTEEEMGAPFEFKVTIDLEGQEPSESGIVQLTSETRRNRVRLNGIQVPGVRSAKVGVTWRDPGSEEWHPESVAWPLEVSLQAVDVTQTLPLEA